MKGKRIKLLALLLVLCMLLTGCAPMYLRMIGQMLGFPRLGMVHFEDMEYVRPDIAALEASQSKVLELAEGKSFNKLVTAVMEFSNQAREFSTAYWLAYIHYCGNTTDTYWDEEYHYCSERIDSVQGLADKMYYALAASDFREKLESDQYFGEGFFADYEGESLWDETFTALKEQETALVNEYYDLMEGARETEKYSDQYYESYAVQMADVFVELVKVRQEIAEHAGYDSYPEFAYDFTFSRDYTPAQAWEYVAQIRDVLVPLYRENADMSAYFEGLVPCSEEESFTYAQSCAENIGGGVAEAFHFMVDAGLYDVTYGENKYDLGFTTYLEAYGEPFVFVCPKQDTSDMLTFTHEFGHFTNYYFAGPAVGIDVAEVQSQGMEYLGLCYGDLGDKTGIARMKMANSLVGFIQQSAFTSFELQVFALEGDDLTRENVCSLFLSVAEDFGMDYVDSSGLDFTTIPHLFLQSQYVISYVVSNDAALQIYQRELEEQGQGVELYERVVTCDNRYFLEFIAEQELKSPFDGGRVEEVRDVLAEGLKG